MCLRKEQFLKSRSSLFYILLFILSLNATMRTLLLLLVLAIIGAQVLVCNAQSCEVVTTTLCEPMVPGMTTTPIHSLTLYVVSFFFIFIVWFIFSQPINHAIFLLSGHRSLCSTDVNFRFHTTGCDKNGSTYQSGRPCTGALPNLRHSNDLCDVSPALLRNSRQRCVPSPSHDLSRFSLTS